MRFKPIPKSKKEKIKTVKVTTKMIEHRCSDECFKPRHKPAPKGLRKVNLGFVYQDKEGKVYIKWKDDNWLQVKGLKFCYRTDGKLIKMFEPAEQMHIHSRGGRTVGNIVRKRDIRVNVDYHAKEAVKKLKRKGSNRKDAQRYFNSKVAEDIPKAPKHKKAKGMGRGAPGVPRDKTGTAQEIIRLINERKTQQQVFNEVIDWRKAQTPPLPVAGPHQTNIKRLIHRWWKKVRP